MSEKTSTEKNTAIQEESEKEESEKEESQQEESQQEESEKESEVVSLKENDAESGSGNHNSKTPTQAFEHLVQVYYEKGPLSRKERIKILKNLRKLHQLMTIKPQV